VSALPLNAVYKVTRMIARTRLIASAILCALIVTACGHAQPFKAYRADDYQWHKNTLYLRAHWNIKKTAPDTVVAEGFVEPFNHEEGLQSVNLELVGLDKDGNVISSAKGMPEDPLIFPPIMGSLFRITLKLKGPEDDFAIRGTYYHYKIGMRPSYSSEAYDTIPLKSDEPY